MPETNNPPHSKSYRAVAALLAPLWPASNIQKRLREEHGIEVSLRAPYNWRRRGISDEVAPAIAAMTGRTVEEVLRVSRKL